MRRSANSEPEKSGPRFGALAVLATCFIVSALIRAGDVVAELPGAIDDGFGRAVPSGPEEHAPAPPTADGTGERPPEVLIAELQRQREKVAARTARLDAREQTLNALEKKLRERLDEIRSARARLAETAALVDDAAGKDVRRLAQMYEQMKPKQAGRIFDRMAPSFAAGFIAEMRPEAAALILANMEAEKAYAVSLLLAGRNIAKPEPAEPPEAAVAE